MQSPSYDVLLKTLDEQPSPRVLRALALMLVLICVGSDKLPGGTWVAVSISMFLSSAAFFVLPTSSNALRLRLALAGYISRLYALSTVVQIGLALSAFILIELLDYRVGGLLLGRTFNLYLCAIFIHSLCFGLRTSLIVWPIASAAVYFFELPPEYSFKLESLKDYFHLLLFVFLGLASASSAFLIRVSSVLYDKMDERH